MGRPAGWGAAQTGRPRMLSPGHPGISRELERGFWQGIAVGKSSEDAAVACGTSPAVGARWFRQAGGMSPLELSPLSGRYLSFAEREEIALLRVQGLGVRAVARRLGRSPATISRELRRNAATRSGQLKYRASTAQWKAERAARRPKPAKLVENHQLRQYGKHKKAAVVACMAKMLRIVFGVLTHRKPFQPTSVQA